MLSRGKLFSILSVCLWTLFIVCLVMLEFVFADADLWVVLSIVSASAVLVFNAMFVFVYIKNRKKVELLQDQYIDSLKPKAPLRFCPPDEELVNDYLTNAKSNNDSHKTNEEQIKTTNEDSVELENEQ